MRRLLVALSIPLGTLIVLVLLDLSGALERFELLTRDLRIASHLGRKPPGDDIVIAWIDQDSIDAVRKEGKLGFPWPRDIYGEALQYIASGGVKAIAVDILWTEPRDNAEEDREFGKALAALRGDVHSFKFMRQRVGGVLEDEPARLLARGHVVERLPPDLPQERGFALPIPEIEAGADALGFVNVRPDPDKVFRHYDLIRVYEGKAYPSLGLATAMVALGEPKLRVEGHTLLLGNNRIPITSGGTLALNFRGPEFTFARIKLLNIYKSAVLVADNKTPLVPKETFKDKVVVFGIHAEGYEDITATPTSPLFMGPELHATALDNLLRGDALQELPLTWPLAAVGAGAASALVFAIASVPQAAAVAVLLWLAFLGLGFACFAANLVVPVAAPMLAVLLTSGAAFLYRLLVEGKKRRELKRAFTSYMAPEVVAEVLRHPERIHLGGETKQITLFFTDLQGFTSLAEHMNPQELVGFLNDYFTRMCDKVMQEKGIIDKFIGDAIMALFGAPLAQPDHSLRAVRAALADLDEMRVMNEELRARQRPDVQMRIGIHTGPAVVGNMGSSKRFDYTAIGDTVNLASRLEGANKAFGTYCLVSETAWQGASMGIAGREVGRVRVMGRGQPIAVYEPFGLLGAVPALDLEFLGRYNQALTALRETDVDRAPALRRGGRAASERRRGSQVSRAPRKARLGRRVLAREQMIFPVS